MKLGSRGWEGGGGNREGEERGEGGEEEEISPCVIAFVIAAQKREACKDFIKQDQTQQTCETVV